MNVVLGHAEQLYSQKSSPVAAIGANYRCSGVGAFDPRQKKTQPTCLRRNSRSVAFCLRDVGDPFALTYPRPTQPHSSHVHSRDLSHDLDKSCSDFYSQALQVLTGPEKRTTADQVLSFIVQSCASPRACLTAFLTALLERGIAAGSMRSAARLGARAGCGKPVAAMACGRWLWKACSCMKPITPPRSVLAREVRSGEWG